MTHAWITFSSAERRCAAALFERMFPADDRGPGAAEIGVTEFVDRALAGFEEPALPAYQRGLAALDAAARRAGGPDFAGLDTAEQDRLIEQLASGELDSAVADPEGFTAEFPPARSDQATWFDKLRANLQEGLFGDPGHGGNKDASGWRVLGHPGVVLSNDPSASFSDTPVAAGDPIKTLADVIEELTALQDSDPIAPDKDTFSLGPDLGDDVDVILVGVGAMGGIVAPVLSKAGLRVIGLEAGPWRTGADVIPDELAATYYCRGGLGSPKFEKETPRWRRSADEDTVPATFSLGRMVNGVGGSAGHYGSWLRRFHPHHFAFRSHVDEMFGADALPENCTLVDYPFDYTEIEPYLTRVEHIVGVAGDDTNPFITRSKPLPLPATEPFKLGEMFKKATTDAGLHPHQVPVGYTTRSYEGRPQASYSAWSNGFGTWNAERWHPGHSCVPEALATGNFQLRLHSKALRVLTGPDGRARGVVYVDQSGRERTIRAKSVVLCAYTYENIRLMYLSGDDRRPNGLGNNTDQLGRHYMTKMFAHVNGYFPDVVFNRHTGPAAQGVVLDDYLAKDFDSITAGGFIGGSTLGTEQQFLPLQISRECLPPDVPNWGAGYRNHITNWQHFGVVRVQSDALPYSYHRIDLDPVHRDRNGFGLPVVRLTYDLQQNERRLAHFMNDRAAELLGEMGATKTWAGPIFTGVGSSHDLGGTRTGVDPNTTVVDPTLQVHDTPGLYVFSGSVMPTCPGINPTLDIWAIILRAADQLVEAMSR